MGQTKTLATQSKNVAVQSVLDDVSIDPRLAMAAKAIQLMAGQNEDGTPKVSADMALAAAMYQAGTGQLLGRDFYVNEKIGRMEGYRGVSRDAVDRGIGDVQIKYRSLTAEENADHEINPGDTAVVCEVYQLRAWQLAQKIGQRYEPVVGVGVVRKVEKYDKKSTQKWDEGARRYVQLPEGNWRLLTLEGGMTWRKKAQNRAYKDALRHVPGGYANGSEVLEEAALRGMTEMPPEAARLTVEQAHEWVEQHGPDWDAVEGEYTDADAEFEALPSASDALPFRLTEAGAIEWALDTVGGLHVKVFDHEKHAKNAFRKLATSSGLTGRELAEAWIADVNKRIAEAELLPHPTHAELDAIAAGEA